MRSLRIASRNRCRRGIATIDYILVLGIILPLATICIPMGIRMVRSVYDIISTLIAWPFM